MTDRRPIGCPRGAPLLTLALAALVAACASESQAPSRPTVPLPFHVGLVPVAVTVSDEDLGVDASETGIELDLRPEDLGAGLAEQFDQRLFTRVTRLDYPPGTAPAEFGTWPVEQQSRWWVDVAGRAGADLLVTSAVQYRRQVRTEGNEKFWPNHLFFLLGGPFTYFTDDRDYYYDTHIQMAIHDMGALRSGQATLTSGGSRLSQVDGADDETALDFIDRVGSDYGYYAASIIIPSGWLAKDTDEVKQELQQTIIQQLGAALDREIRSRGEDLLRADRLVDFFVRPEEIEVLEGPRGLEMHGTVYLELGRGTDRMDSWRAWPTAGPPFEAVFGEGVPATVGPSAAHYLRYAFAVPLSQPTVPESLRVEFEDGSAGANRRSFHFPLKALEAGSGSVDDTSR